MYKLARLNYGETVSSSVIRLSDMAGIPFDENNKDYVEYLAWLSEGNTPLPADDPA